MESNKPLRHELEVAATPGTAGRNIASDPLDPVAKSSIALREVRGCPACQETPPTRGYSGDLRLAPYTLPERICISY